MKISKFRKAFIAAACVLAVGGGAAAIVASNDTSATPNNSNQYGQTITATGKVVLMDHDTGSDHYKNKNCYVYSGIFKTDSGKKIGFNVELDTAGKKSKGFYDDFPGEFDTYLTINDMFNNHGKAQLTYKSGASSTACGGTVYNLVKGYESDSLSFVKAVQPIKSAR